MFHLLYNFLNQITRTAQQTIIRQYCDCERGCTCLLPINDVKRFVADCFSSLGAPETNSEILADAIVEADYRGVSSHGILRLEKIIQDVENCICDPKAVPKIVDEFISVALVNGNNALGPVTGKFCMDIAMEKAIDTGIGMVAAKGSNYYGMPSLYTMQAAKKGLIGLSFSNSIPEMVPPGALEAALGSNPLSIAAPAHCDFLVFDMSTTTTTLPKIEEYARKKMKLPPGWALGNKGEMEEDPENAIQFTKLTPFGGDQCHKGYGLALLVEVLSGLLADANSGPEIPNPKEKCKDVTPNLGHGFIAINPDKFVPDFATRLSKLLSRLRNMEAIDSKHPILVPGDKEQLHMKQVDCADGISYSKYQLEILENLSKKLGVRPLECCNIKALEKSVKKKTESCNKSSNQNLCHKQKNKEEGTSNLLTTTSEACRFITDCFLAVGAPQEHADIVAKSLVETDYIGHYSHGMNRLEMYIEKIQKGLVDPKATCCILKESIATALVDGNNGLGAVIGKYCMNLAVEKACDAGIGIVSVRGSNHFGINRIYSYYAVKEGFLGLCFSNTSPFMVPTGSKKAVLGTNPLSLGAPGVDEDDFLLDFATTVVAVGKIELARKQGIKIPTGWALNDDGKDETDPDVAVKAAKLLPLGGDALHSGHKGFGMAMLVEIFSGILSGSKYGPYIGKWGGDEIANLGQCFIAIDPDCFADGFKERLTDLMNYIRNLEPIDAEHPIMVHGDAENKHKEKVDKDGGLLYVQAQHEVNAKLAKRLNVKPMVSKKLNT